MALSKVLIRFVCFCLIKSCTSLSTQGERARVQITKPRSTEDLYVADIEAFGEKFELTLSPLDDIWSKNAQIMSFTKGNNIELLEKTQLSKRTRVYHDQASGAVLTVDDGNINGVLDSQHTITGSNGVHFAYKLDLTDYRYDDIEVPKNDSNVESLPMHIIMDDEHLTTPPLNNFATNTVSEIKKNSWNVEVLIVIDSVLSNTIGTDEEIYEYETIFWNAVNKLFRNIETPKFNIKLVGAYIIRDEEGEPFITSNLHPNQPIKAGECLYSFTQWSASDPSRLPSHDLIYLQTGRKLGYNSSYLLLGMGYVGQICSKYSSALGSDMGAFFMGANTAKHEVAHVLGAPHDGLKNVTDSCPWSDGYFMGGKIGMNRFFFSECSKAKMAEYTNRSCLNSDLDPETLPNVFENKDVLPGEVYSMDEQCKRITGKANSHVDTSVSPQDKLCQGLVCNYVDDNYGPRIWISPYTTLEGSPCPHGGACQNGSCV